MELKVGDAYDCPEGHKASIVWISEDKKVMAVKCPRRHLSKVEKVADHTDTVLERKEKSTSRTWSFSSESK